MKTKIFTFIILSSLISPGIIAQESHKKTAGSKSHTINIVCMPVLQNLANAWTVCYCDQHPDMDVQLIPASVNNIPEKLKQKDELCLITESCYKNLSQGSLIALPVGRSIVVPVINVENPAAEQIFKNGVPAEVLCNLLKDDKKTGWNEFLETEQYIPVHYYGIRDEIASKCISEFLKEDISAHKVADNKQELLAALQKDKYAIAFCKLTDIMDMQNHAILSNLHILPIDRNSNGKIDYFEDFYSALSDFTRAVWIGKYPPELSSEIYLVSGSLPESKPTIAFLEWASTGGQQLMEANGFTGLTSSERVANLEKISVQEPLMAASVQDQNNFLSFILIILAVFIVAAIILRLIAVKGKEVGEQGETVAPIYPKVINESNITIPKGLYFDKSHTWAFMEKDGLVKIGIDDFLQHVTGRISTIKIPSKGEKITKNSQLISLTQDGKQIKIHAPLSGRIVAVNEEVAKNPALINSSPYNEGWLYKIEPSNWLREIQFMRMADKYREWIKNEITRLKDFLVLSVNLKSENNPAFQEGGEVLYGVLEKFGPGTWEDFQKNFIDISEIR
ncbi:MAG: hypothetical protein K9G67_04310 [Bacteroidales bacterium]|nr:hypothetical protein [Bacteroidales bacterium]MCF8343409.1 hypothetical protein [Bacteroidales bacterium]MCF8349849.1 hypothetical protein [Bacteroidales bacterium]MCF8375555.1 hypothetical protein [Bacteroidales bacterium]MCF8399954.1 hypothetical protein [Bacteroidales bacterium]